MKEGQGDQSFFKKSILLRRPTEVEKRNSEQEVKKYTRQKRAACEGRKSEGDERFPITSSGYTTRKSQ